MVHFHHAHRPSGVRLDSHGVVLFGIGNYCFPPARSKSAPFLRETATWRVAFTPQAEIAKITVLPLVLDNHGLPQRARGDQGRRISGNMERYSRRIERRGIQLMLRTLAVGLKAQLR
jgi:hypothetical protein